VKNKVRKPSWLFLDLAFKIQVAPRHYAAKLVLLFLAKTANNSGRSYHGYRSISAHLQLGHSAIHTALCCLRDELGILTWQQGSGGFQKKDTNDYRLDLQAMTALVEAQGIFNAEGKLIRSATCTPQPEDDSHFHSVEPTTTESDSSHFHSAEPTEPKSLPLSGISVVSTERAVVSTERKVVSTEGQSPLRSAEHNPQIEQPSEKATLKNNPRPGPFFSGESSEHVSLEVAEPEHRADRLPNPPPPPKAGGVKVTWGDPIPGFRFRCGDNPGYVNLSTGLLTSFEEAQRVAQMEAN
jgi:hypothetical protein